MCVWVCGMCADECTNKSKVWKVRLQKLNMHSVALMITWSDPIPFKSYVIIIIKTCTEVCVCCTFSDVLFTLAHVHVDELRPLHTARR